MESLKVLIVEDELIAAVDLKETLQQTGHKITAVARNFEEVNKAVIDILPDIALVDINLKGSKDDGISIAKKLKNKYSFPIIFLTGDQDKETFNRAKETLPSAYILKPFKANELPYQVELAYYHFKSQRLTINPKLTDDIYLPSSKGLTKINKNDVVYLKANGSYVNIFLKNEPESLLFSMNLGYLSQFFPENFYQISRSYVINLDYIERLDNQKVKLKGVVEPVQIPESKKAALFKILPIVRTV